jgi:hypothetical protein
MSRRRVVADQRVVAVHGQRPDRRRVVVPMPVVSGGGVVGGEHGA